MSAFEKLAREYKSFNKIDWTDLSSIEKLDLITAAKDDGLDIIYDFKHGKLSKYLAEDGTVKIERFWSEKYEEVTYEQ